MLGSVGNDDPRILLPHKVDVAHGKVLADDVSPVVTLGVVPGQAVIEKVIQDGQASLLPKAVLFEDPVRLSSASGTSPGPGVELPAREDVCWSHRSQGGRPKPTVYVVRLEPRLVTAINLLVTQPSTGPHLAQNKTVNRTPTQAAPAHLSYSCICHVLSNKFLLPCTLQGDQIHTSHPAVVPGSEPVPPSVPQ